MALNYKDTTRNARLDRLTTDLGATASFEVFTGTPPGKTSGTFNADTGTPLVRMAMSNPVAPGSTGGVLTFSTITTTNAIASGTPGYFRLKTANSGAASTVIVEGTAGVGSGDLNFNSTLVSGAAVSITSGTVTEGNNG